MHTHIYNYIYIYIFFHANTYSPHIRPSQHLVHWNDPETTELGSSWGSQNIFSTRFPSHGGFPIGRHGTAAQRARLVRLSQRLSRVKLWSIGLGRITLNQDQPSNQPTSQPANQHTNIPPLQIMTLILVLSMFLWLSGCGFQPIPKQHSPLTSGVPAFAKLKTSQKPQKSWQVGL